MLDGDANDANDVGDDRIDFGPGVVVTSAGSLTLQATTGDLAGAVAGAVTLTADDGITINDPLTTSGATTINADADADDNDGTLTVVTTASVVTNNNTLAVTADDLDLQGASTLNSGTAPMTITA